MHNYKLQSNESVLYRGDVSLSGRKGAVELMLTNLNVIFLVKVRKKVFTKLETEVEIYPVNTIKVYEGEPQLKQSNCKLEIYFTTGEINISFASKKELMKFKQATRK